MMLLNPYISECDSYHQTPLQHRWIYNKLELAEHLRLGPCGPLGTWMPEGEFCIRPIINIGGMARGGFKKVTVEKSRDIIHDPSGYCWTTWSNGFRAWRLYIDDEMIHVQTTLKIVDGIEHMEIGGEPMDLPLCLTGISRYMMVETIGDVIVDVSPRHMVEEMSEEVIADFRQFHKLYVPPAWGHYGFQPWMATDFDGEWYRHREIKEWQ